MPNPHYRNERDNNVRVLWNGEHKNSVYLAVERNGKHCYTVTMRDRFVYGITVTDTSVRKAYNRAMTAMFNALNDNSVE